MCAKYYTNIYLIFIIYIGVKEPNVLLIMIKILKYNNFFGKVFQFLLCFKLIKLIFLKTLKKYSLANKISTLKSIIIKMLLNFTVYIDIFVNLLPKGYNKK